MGLPFLTVGGVERGSEFFPLKGLLVFGSSLADLCFIGHL